MSKKTFGLAIFILGGGRLPGRRWSRNSSGVPPPPLSITVLAEGPRASLSRAFLSAGALSAPALARVSSPPNYSVMPLVIGLIRAIGGTGGAIQVVRSPAATPSVPRPQPSKAEEAARRRRPASWSYQHRGRGDVRRDRAGPLACRAPLLSPRCPRSGRGIAGAGRVATWSQATPRCSNTHPLSLQTLEKSTICFDTAAAVARVAARVH